MLSSSLCIDDAIFCAAIFCIYGLLITTRYFKKITSIFIYYTRLFHDPENRLDIVYRKDCVFLRLHGQKLVSPCSAISAMLDSKGRAIVLIQVLYDIATSLKLHIHWTALDKYLSSKSKDKCSGCCTGICCKIIRASNVLSNPNHPRTK